MDEFKTRFIDKRVTHNASPLFGDFPLRLNTSWHVHGINASPLWLGTAANQLAAAFGSVRQSGSVPPATESLNQQHCARHSSSKDVHRGDFIRQGGILSGNHFKIAGNSTFISGG